MPERCPACKKQVPPGATVCPYCPMSFESDEDAERARASRIPPFVKLTVWLAALLALGWGGWNALSFVLRYGSATVTGNDLFGLSGGASQPNGTGRTRPGAYPWDGIHARTTYLKPKNIYSGGDEGDAVTIVTPQNAPTQRSGWVFEGTVFNLETLRPVPEAELIFSSRRARGDFRTKTDAKGRYGLRVPFLNGGAAYAVRILRKGYARSYLDPQTEGVMGMPLDERRRLSRSLNGSLLGPYPLQGLGARPLEVDFYLAPIEPRSGD
ncbi:MAG: hypothetical protein KGL04_10470 [Elusimicrobia bacterium]|nr:hypothetical protein [Elusimicrobiota bacterium]MDE2314581.1 hypothetical protein [Elusimicrobiota bacterium]